MYITATVSSVVGLAAAVGEGETMPLIPDWEELVFGLVMFAILFWVVAKKVAPNLEQAYEERHAAIEGGIARAENAQGRGRGRQGPVRGAAGRGPCRGRKIREDARAEGAAIVAEMRGQARDESNRITDSAQKQIAAERQQASVSLRSEVGRLSTDPAGRIVGHELQDSSSRQGLIDSFLAELESGKVQPEKVGAAAAPSAAAEQGQLDLGDAGRDA
ncbi:F0F1 ATP synthase subunit B [Janibacter limosus]|uniref:F0F1 ATP synthase subunit B n=1 Tax=Janibacter limosus TaxID=53458 RepID=UPI0035DEA3FA|nr:F0F1 ATP synthase subunit B [Janibacter limosus]